MTGSASNYEIRRLCFDHNHGTYETIKIGAGQCKTERVVPPAGEKYAFTISTWTTNVEITVSPTGRSVQVFIDGEKVR